MRKRLKRVWRTIISLEFLILLALVVTILLVLFSNSFFARVKANDLLNLKSLKDCMTNTLKPSRLDLCASSLGLTENEAKELAEKIYLHSENVQEQAWASFILKNYTDSVTKLAGSMELNPYDLRNYRDLAFIYILAKQYNESTSLCDKVLESVPNDLTCLDLNAIAYYAINKNSEALNNSLKTYKMNQSFCHDLNLGLYYGANGNLTKAQEFVDKVLNENRTLVLNCWSPIMSNKVLTNVDNYQLCFKNQDNTRTVCRTFSNATWVVTENKPKLPEGLPEPVFST